MQRIATGFHDFDQRPEDMIDLLHNLIDTGRRKGVKKHELTSEHALPPKRRQSRLQVL